MSTAYGDRPGLTSEGEKCVVCRRPVTEDTMALDMNRCDLHEECVPEYEATRAEWLAEDNRELGWKEALS